MSIFTIPRLDADHKAGIDFATQEIVGEVRGVRDFDGWNIVSLADGRTVTGTFDYGSISQGVAYRFFGSWTSHSAYGPQFRCESHVLADKQGRTGVIAYLTRTGVNLTKVQAGKLFDAFGGDAIERLRNNPAACGKIIDAPERAEKAAVILNRMLADEPTRVELFGIFGGRGIPKGAIEGCIKLWGAKAPGIIRRDPYKMLVHEIPGIGFKRADDLYLDMHLPVGRLKRQMIAGWNALRESNTGNTWDDLRIAEKGILSKVGFTNPDVRLCRAIELGIRARWLTKRVDETGEWIAECDKATAEQRLANHVKRILKHAPVLPHYGYGMVADGISEHQLATTMGLVTSPFMVLAGCPGVGKTFVAAAILKRAVGQLGAQRIAVCAPTGKAAVRITEAMQKYNLPFSASTIHSLLGVVSCDGGNWTFRRDESCPLDYSLVVMDEGSMTDTPLFAALLAAIPRGGNVLIVGDPYQLPPVGHGAPLRDLIAAGVPCGTLTEIRRNSGAIVEACSAIKDGMRPVVFQSGNIEAGENLIHIDCEQDLNTRLAWIASILSKIHGDGEWDRVWDVLILTATNKTRKELNRNLQDGLNPQPDGYAQENLLFRVGDKIICLKNTKAKLVEFVGREEQRQDYNRWKTGTDQAYLANGDTGRVLAVKKTGAIVWFFSPDRIVQITTEKPRKGADGEEIKTGDFDLAYAITTHKCVHPDTLVETSDGLLPISKIDRDGGLIAAPLGPLTYRNYVANPAGPALRFELDGGYELTATPEHKMEVWRNGSFVMVEAAAVSISDKMRLRLGITVDPPCPAFLPPLPEGDARSVRHKTPNQVDEDFAEFLGLMVADGTIFHSGFRLLKRHTDVIERFAGLCRSMFGCSLRAVNVGETFGYEVSSRLLVEWLRYIGGMTPNAKDVPECILASPAAIHWKFLKGLFEDGFVNVKDGAADYVGWTTTSEPLLQKVRVMLLRAGIITGTVHTKSGAKTLAIYGKHIGTFRDLIGFVSEFKNKRLQSHRYGEPKFTIPVAKDELKAIRQGGGIGERDYRNGRYRGAISRQTAVEIVGKTGNPFMQSCLDFHYAAVKSITPTVCESRCVEVPDGHKFLQNGIVAGNSQGSEAPVVIVNLEDSIVTSREHLYTSISRASKVCILLGSLQTMMRMVGKVSLQDRKTFLKELLTESKTVAAEVVK